MNFTYENQGASTLLVYTIGENDQLDSMSVGMITNNKIPGLVSAVFTQMDTDRFIKYNVSSKISVKQFFSGPVNKKRLLGVFRGVVDAMLSAEEYMIDPAMIIIDTDYMYTDVSTCETVLICLPVIQKEQQQTDLGAFFKTIMFTTQFDQTESCDYVARIINYLNSASTFSIEHFKSLLAEIGGVASSAQASQSAGHPPVGGEVRPSQPVASAAQPFQPVVSTAQLAQPGVGQRLPQAQPAPIQPPAKGKVPPVRQVLPQVPMQQSATSQLAGEKEISLFYLLQHYNKENAASYKAQKERRKAQKSAKAGQQPPTKKNSADKQQKMPSFAVPGQPVAPAAPSALTTTPRPAAAPVPAVERPAGSAQGVPPVDLRSGQMASSPAGVKAVPAAGMGAQHRQEPDMFGDFGGTVYFSEEYQEDSATVVMGQEKPMQQIVPHLLRKRNNEKIPINKPIFRLGRDIKFNDYAIIDNIYVGHSHCHIVSRDGEYFVIDDNSKNHTAVNGVNIPSGQEVKLAHGYILSVADEEFEFKLY